MRETRKTGYQNTHRTFAITGLLAVVATLLLPSCTMLDLAAGTEVPNGFEMPDTDAEMLDVRVELSDDSALAAAAWWNAQTRTNIHGVQNWDSSSIHTLAAGQSLVAPLFYTGHSNNETVMARCSVSQVMDSGQWKWPWQVAGFDESTVNVSIETTYAMLTAFQHEVTCFNDSSYPVKVTLMASSILH